jgi:hypothetical protein
MILDNQIGGTSIEERGHSRGAPRNEFAEQAASALDTIDRLTQFCRTRKWAGYDPYDALNSALLASLLPAEWRMPRLALTQLLKRSPINVRALLGVPRTANAKAIALFISAFVKLRHIEVAGSGELVQELAAKLMQLRSPQGRHCAWGYSFPWQSRHVLVERGTPNVVCTTFAGNALLDAYELCGEESYLDAALSATRYLVERLYWLDRSGSAGFRYPHPGSQLVVHNANLLAAAFLCRAHRHRGDQNLLALCVDVAHGAVAKQQPDGSWYYGESPEQRWIDNFHTGYNLCALNTIARATGIRSFEESVRLGFRFYIDHLVTPQGVAKYFSDRTYPIDAHSVAQSLITLVALQALDPSSMERAGRVLAWAMENLWDEAGYFYYQVNRFGKTKIEYMRWSQAWMLLALAAFVESVAAKRYQQ